MTFKNILIYSVISARFVETKNVTDISENFDVSSEEVTSVKKFQSRRISPRLKTFIGLYIVESCTQIIHFSSRKTAVEVFTTIL